jgi:NhaP-type Na+/H+ or K+/H+ antiporter
LAVFQAKRVDPQLFYLVFGESVLNDAVGLVLFKAFARFVTKDNKVGKVAVDIFRFILGFTLDAVGSPILGLVCGCGAALLFKHIDMRKNRLLELSLYVLIMYVPFLLAELIGLSGIVTILFTGMAARTYVVPNLSTATATNADLLFRLAAHLAESAIFLELGLSVFGLSGSFMLALSCGLF